MLHPRARRAAAGWSAGSLSEAPKRVTHAALRELLATLVAERTCSEGNGTIERVDNVLLLPAAAHVLGMLVVERSSLVGDEPSRRREIVSAFLAASRGGDTSTQAPRRGA